MEEHFLFDRSEIRRLLQSDEYLLYCLFACRWACSWSRSASCWGFLLRLLVETYLLSSSLPNSAWLVEMGSSCDPNRIYSHRMHRLASVRPVARIWIRTIVRAGRLRSHCVRIPSNFRNFWTSSLILEVLFKLVVMINKIALSPALRMTFLLNGSFVERLS